MHGSEFIAEHSLLHHDMRVVGRADLDWESRRWWELVVRVREFTAEHITPLHHVHARSWSSTCHAAVASLVFATGLPLLFKILNQL